MEWYTWVFSGIGSTVVAALIGRSYYVRQKQKSGDNSSNIQAGRDVNIDKGGQRRD